jgi:hypothetical protein
MSAQTFIDLLRRVLGTGGKQSDGVVHILENFQLLGGSLKLTGEARAFGCPENTEITLRPTGVALDPSGLHQAKQKAILKLNYSIGGELTVIVHAVDIEPAQTQGKPGRRTNASLMRRYNALKKEAS